jgi:hypothetical protein
VIVGAGIDQVVVTEFPTQLILTTAVRLVADETDRAEHTLEFRFHDLDPLDPKGRIEATFSFGDAPANKPAGWELSAIVPIVHQFEVSEPGPHSIEVFLDGGHKKTVPILVMQPGD